MILVTGGTGLIGSHLLYRLCQNNSEVRAIRRAGSKPEKVKRVFSYYTETPEDLYARITWVEADLTDIPALEKSLRNVDTVYHCAGLISFDPRDFNDLLKTNYEGTRNLINLCLSEGISHFCHVSSIAAIGGRSSRGKKISEDEPWDGLHAHGYGISKYMAEMEVWRGQAEGLNTVIVNPGVVLGPGFWNDGSGKFFSRTARGLRFYPPGKTGFISVQDTVKCMTALVAKGITKNRFILVAENRSYEDLIRLIGTMFGLKRFKRLKFWQLQILWRLDWIKGSLGGKRSLLKEMVYSMKHPQEYDNSKIRALLEIDFEPFEAFIPEVCAHFKAENP